MAWGYMVGEVGYREKGYERDEVGDLLKDHHGNLYLCMQKSSSRATSSVTSRPRAIMYKRSFLPINHISKTHTPLVSSTSRTSS